MSTNNRKACRQGRRCDPRSLGEVLYCLVHHSDVDAKQIAERLGVRHGYLLDAANPDREDTQFQLRWVVPLIQATGRCELLDYLEEAAGRVAIAVPTAAPVPGDLPSAAAKAMHEFAEDLDLLARALADGQITRDEAEAFAREAHQTMAALAQLVGLLENRVPLLRERTFPRRQREG